MKTDAPLELIADWLLARYPFEALAAQVGMPPERLEERLGCLLPDPGRANSGRQRGRK
jgi:hypothetical protein